MTSALDKLIKILQLEQEQGYRDKAVIGGLARFADAWLEQAGADTQDEEWVAQIAGQMRAYSQLTAYHERQAGLEALRAALRAGPRSRVEESLAAPPPAVAPLPWPGRARGQGQGHSHTPTPPAGPAVSRVERPAAPSPAASSRTRGGQDRPRSPVRHEDLGLDSPITVLSGVGPTQSKRLARLGLRVVRDMLYFFPRRYDDFSTLKTINQLEYGEEVTVMGRIWDAKTRRTRSGKVVTKAIIEDGSGTIEVTWFNQPHLSDKLKPLRQIVLSGRVDEYMGRLTFQSPQWEPLDRELLHTARLVPVYPLTEGISARWLRKLMKRTVDYWSHRVPDHLPAEVRQRVGLLDLEVALRQIHFPETADRLKKARYRLAFDELFLIQIGVLRQRHQWQSEPGQALSIDDVTLRRFILSLPFTLTGAQGRALDEIVHDLRRDRPMNRLLQGDVGSGKTVVAAAAIALTVAAGAQAALMAPTEILAEQHYRTFSRLLDAGADPQGAVGNVNVRLLTGSTPSADKEAIYQGLADGRVDVVIGTHALIQEGVQFQRLALAIIDEQHRFGVAQRAALRHKGLRPEAPLALPSRASEPEGYNPHVLVMTATPIPRSLALTVYGDLDLSIIDEMPPGRRPIETRLLLPTERERAYAFVRSQIERGRQAFIICPLVEESEKIEAKAAVEEYQRLQGQVFPDLRLGLLHGRMKGEEKEAVMAQFVQGELHILVSTSVVEVGIDVPNASVMLVEGANRFGLAQLHQFRGRVGRGEHPSYCLLIADSTTATSEERLKAVEGTTDGFVLAEKDLELRGPGEFFGTRQSGLPDLRLAGFADVRLLEVARREAQRLFEADPQLASPDLRLLVKQVDRFWSGEGDVS
jgi:ATP-dependent DNA helicase RecG